MKSLKMTNKELFLRKEELLGDEVELSGWIRNIRAQKNLIFIDFNDGSYFKNVQLVAETEETPEFEEIAKAGNGTAIVIKGLVVGSVNSKQSFEVKISAFRITGICPPDYPLQPKRHSPEFLRSIGHLRARTNLFSAVFRVRSEAAFAIHKFFNERGFVYVHTDRKSVV